MIFNPATDEPRTVAEQRAVEAHHRGATWAWILQQQARGLLPEGTTPDNLKESPCPTPTT